MAKVHPRTSTTSSSCHENSSSEREVFTVWMKSLVVGSNGCTVFNSKGEIVFRVDNYQTRCSSEVLLMDYNGRVLFSIKRKKLLIFRSWEGYRWTNSEFDEEEGEWFKVKRKCKFFRRGISSCHVILGCNKTRGRRCYTVLGLEGKPTIKITDCTGRVLAEVMQKQSFGGVSLGDDVLSLMVEPQIDQSLIMALVIVYAMINHKL
ncbi:protein LURP-one-related 11-like [Sesamum indicum]|uniref:Protein LURP-one-related 11-like n=1 Tax=Sesamum indicum TaxID=4182 RepID=A0A6I9SWX7_SESIN|nr:protein LURP-one-related 11-like [Sesamum indicum]